jgi:hypothetical protein
MSHCGTQLVRLEQDEKWNAWIPSRAAKKVGRPFLHGRPGRDQYVVLLGVITADQPFCGQRPREEEPPRAAPQALLPHGR